MAKRIHCGQIHTRNGPPCSKRPAKRPRHDTGPEDGDDAKEQFCRRHVFRYGIESSKLFTIQPGHDKSRVIERLICQWSMGHQLIFFYFFKSSADLKDEFMSGDGTPSTVAWSIAHVEYSTRSRRVWCMESVAKGSATVYDSLSLSTLL
ncbi:hypothetical protein BC939DRAFT_478432 [Gamsiella multidivaricata]|uniref:uncharacterized protein n=1 Tax=Gamsiella multidivaricata TaxID=101098 RepID=UPI00221F96D7|nr:uncharacterized protein BC939DRAFT_478432 [Gamsiella multidivaricata]KAI7821199.1 hypothetical protein BC939DRAFT_478432 [Gamsiella multidivaricata]